MKRDKETGKVYIHADDYGMNMESSRRILECFSEGCLEGISFLPNGCREAVRLADGYVLRKRVHMNLVEGRCISPVEEVRLLVDDRGYFRYSFTGLLLLLLSPKRKKAQEQIAVEMERQLRCAVELIGRTEIGIDSHQHTLMIPAVFRIFCRVADEMGISIESIRIPAEPILPFLRHPSLWRTYRPINIVKNFLLNFLYLLIRKDFKRLGVKRGCFLGVMFSGRMDAGRILKVLPDFKRIAEKKQTYIEILFHPGYIKKEETPMDGQKRGFLQFYYSQGRQTDETTLKSREFYEQVKRILF